MKKLINRFIKYMIWHRDVELELQRLNSQGYHHATKIF